MQDAVSRASPDSMVTSWSCTTSSLAGAEHLPQLLTHPALQGGRQRPPQVTGDEDLSARLRIVGLDHELAARAVSHVGRPDEHGQARTRPNRRRERIGDETKSRQH